MNILIGDKIMAIAKKATETYGQFVKRAYGEGAYHSFRVNMMKIRRYAIKANAEREANGETPWASYTDKKTGKRVIGEHDINEEAMVMTQHHLGIINKTRIEKILEASNKVTKASTLESIRAGVYAKEFIEKTGNVEFTDEDGNPITLNEVMENINNGSMTEKDLTHYIDVYKHSPEYLIYV